jgi:hypothetical protein
MPDSPQEPPVRVRRRRYHRGRPGPDWNVIAIASALILTTACVGTVVWAFGVRRPAQAVNVKPKARTAEHQAPPAPSVVPAADRSAAKLIREMGDDGALAAKLGMNAGDDSGSAARPSGLPFDPRGGNLAITRTSLGPGEPAVAEARAALDAYLAEPTWRAKLSHVFRTARCEALMPEYYDKRGETEPVPHTFEGAGLITAGDVKVVNLIFSRPDRPDAELRAFFHRGTAGNLLLDWEAWTGFSEKSWPDLKKERSTSPVLMRAIAEKSDRYNHEFIDAERWLAVKLGSPDGAYSITGYCERRSGTGIALASLIGEPLSPGNSKKVPAARIDVTVRVAFPAAAQSDDCVNITRLLADRWMLLDGEF